MKKVIKDTTPITDAISQIAMVGNVIPHSWYSAIRLTYGNKGQTKPDLYAINFLADLVYWYRNQQVRDELTGELVTIRKKFRVDKLQRSYADIGAFFGLSADVGKEIVERLRRMGLIKTEVRKKVVDGERVFFNVLFIEPVPKAILAITHDSEVLETKARTTQARVVSHLPAGAGVPAGTTATSPAGAGVPDIYNRFQVQEITSFIPPYPPRGDAGEKKITTSVANDGQQEKPDTNHRGQGGGKSKKRSADADSILLAECDLKSVPVELVTDYLQYRRLIKHPLKTEQGLQTQINALDALGSVDAMWAALGNTKDHEYRKIVPKAPVEPSSPTTGMVVVAGAHGLTNGTVEAEMALMIQHYKAKGVTIWDYDAAFARWLDNKAKFEAQRPSAKTGGLRFSPSKDTSWIKDIDPAELGFDCTPEQWRNA